MNADKTTTRKQLQGYGITCYQARAVTQSLVSEKHGRTYTYRINDVIASIRQYLQRPRLKLEARQKLEGVLQKLLDRLANVIEIPLGNSSNSEISNLAKQLSQAMANTNKIIVDLEATAATIKGKYGI